MNKESYFNSVLVIICYNIYMDKKSKVLLWVIVVAIFVSVGVTFYKTIILQDFEVVNTGEGEVEEQVL
mgnify:FL=1